VNCHWHVTCSEGGTPIERKAQPEKPRIEALKPAQRRNLQKKAATPRWKNKTTRAKKI